MMGVSVATEPELTLSKPRVLWEQHYRHGTSVSCGGAGATSTNYDLTADGERFVMIQDTKEDIGARAAQHRTGMGGGPEAGGPGEELIRFIARVRVLCVCDCHPREYSRPCCDTWISASSVKLPSHTL